MRFTDFPQEQVTAALRDIREAFPNEEKLLMENIYPICKERLTKPELKELFYHGKLIDVWRNSVLGKFLNFVVRFQENLPGWSVSSVSFKANEGQIKEHLAGAAGLLDSLYADGGTPEKRVRAALQDFRTTVAKFKRKFQDGEYDTITANLNALEEGLNAMREPVDRIKALHERITRSPNHGMDGR